MISMVGRFESRSIPPLPVQKWIWSAKILTAVEDLLLQRFD